MPLPPELDNIPEPFAVLGDLDAFIEYLESGQAAQDWEERMAMQRRALDELRVTSYN